MLAYLQPLHCTIDDTRACSKNKILLTILNMATPKKTSQEQVNFEQEYAFRSVELFKTETLGTGSYGAVCKARCDQLICAAKLLYPVLFQMITPDPGKQHRQPMKRFELECRFLSLINHPNIIQYLGTYRDPDTNAPVLLMELMDESLTHFLESSPGDIPYHIQVNLSYDIAQALAFLHSNEIIHRDLSSNNVLLLAGRAKVADFGMSKFDTHLATMTTCPGTAAYMSPEALNTPPVYTEKLDNFSLGVLILQTMTRKYPNPSDQFITKELVDPHFPSRKIKAKVPVPETERREAHISLTDIFNPLLQTALDCLADNETDRPTSKKLCQKFALLKESNKYTESAQKDMGKLLREKICQSEEQKELIKAQKQELEMIKKQKEGALGMIQESAKEETCTPELKEHTKLKEIQLQSARQQLRTQDDQLLRKDDEIQELRAALQEKERALEQLQQKRDTAREHNTTDRGSLHNIITTESTPPHPLSNTHTYRESPSNTPTHTPSSTPSSTPVGTPTVPRKRTAWKRPIPPCPTFLKAGSSAVCGNDAYFRGAGSNQVYKFDASERRWRSIGQHPFFGFTLVAIENTLTTVGGFNKESSNKLFDLVDGIWVENLPEMPTSRDRPAAAYTNGYLIVAGGKDVHSEPLQSVNILQLDTKQWAKAAVLPFQTHHASVTICDDKIYLTAGDDIEDCNSFAVLSCSISALLQSRRSLSLGARLKKALQPSNKVWQAIADLPTSQSYLVNSGDQLIAIGGSDVTGKSSKNVYKYDSVNNTWIIVVTMTTGRSSCLGAVFMENLLMVVGGYKVTTKEAEAVTLL